MNNNSITTATPTLAEGARPAGVNPQPLLIVDTREQKPLVFRHLHSVRDTLQSGDYSARGLTDVFAVERKSMKDLVSSITRNRARFLRELHRLRGYGFARLLVVGTLQELEEMESKGRAHRKHVEHSLLSIEERFHVPVYRVDTPELAAQLVETWAFAAWRNAAAKLGIVLPFPEWTLGVLSRG